MPGCSLTKEAPKQGHQSDEGVPVRQIAERIGCTPQMVRNLKCAPTNLPHGVVPELKKSLERPRKTSTGTDNLMRRDPEWPIDDSCTIETKTFGCYHTNYPWATSKAFEVATPSSCHEAAHYGIHVKLKGLLFVRSTNTGQQSNGARSCSRTRRPFLS